MNTYYHAEITDTDSFEKWFWDTVQASHCKKIF